MGQAKHKKQHSTLQATTSLDPDGAAQLVKHVGDSIKSSIPGAAYVRFEGAAPGQLTFTVRGGGHTWGGGPVMSFIVKIERNAGGLTIVSTHIDAFRTTQQTVMFIPVSPKSLNGYRTYKRFADELATALRQQDPQSVATLTEVRQA